MGWQEDEIKKQLAAGNLDKAMAVKEDLDASRQREGQKPLSMKDITGR